MENGKLEIGLPQDHEWMVCNVTIPILHSFFILEMTLLELHEILQLCNLHQVSVLSSLQVQLTSAFPALKFLLELFHHLYKPSSKTVVSN